MKNIGHSSYDEFVRQDTFTGKLLRRFSLGDKVKGYGTEKNGTLYNLLPVDGPSEKGHSHIEDAHDHGSDDSTDNGTDTACGRGTSDIAGSHCVKLESVTGLRSCGTVPFS